MRKAWPHLPSYACKAKENSAEGRCLQSENLIKTSMEPEGCLHTLVAQVLFETKRLIINLGLAEQTGILHYDISCNIIRDSTYRGATTAVEAGNQLVADGGGHGVTTTDHAFLPGRRRTRTKIMKQTPDLRRNLD
jgi:hypothetical protein